MGNRVMGILENIVCYSIQNYHDLSIYLRLLLCLSVDFYFTFLDFFFRWIIFKVSIEFVTILLLFYVLDV